MSPSTLRLTAVAAFLGLSLSLAGAANAPAGASAKPQAAAAKPAAAPQTAEVGIYIIDLRDLSPAKGTFTCDFWIWSRTQIQDNILSELQFVNAEKVLWYAEAKPEVPGMTCYKRRGTGVFRMGWNLSRYPFDTQLLPIQMEYTLKDSSRILLTADTVNSGISTKNIPPGWKLKAFALETDTVAYSSNLGDSGLGAARGEFARATAMIDVSRNDTAEYWSLVSSAYVGLVMMLVSYFMEVDKPASRFALLGASLFATVISLRSALAGLGNFGTLADRFHLLVIGFIVFSLGFTIFLSQLHHRGVDDRRLRLWSVMAAGAVAATFACLNFLMFRYHAA